MAVSSNVRSSLSPWYLQPVVRFLATLSGSRSMRPGRLPTRSCPIRLNSRFIEVSRLLHSPRIVHSLHSCTVCLKLKLRGCQRRWLQPAP